MRTIVVDHPLVAHKLTALRDENTDSPTFRRLVDQLVTLLAYEATRDVRVEPFDITTEYPTSVNGVAMPTYIDWMRSCWYVTLTACPAISVPAGFTASGLPVGIQIVGPHRGDLSVLQMAHAFEQATKFGARRPVV